MALVAAPLSGLPEKVKAGPELKSEPDLNFFIAAAADIGSTESGAVLFSLREAVASLDADKMRQPVLILGLRGGFPNFLCSLRDSLPSETSAIRQKFKYIQLFIHAAPVFGPMKDRRTH